MAILGCVIAGYLAHAENAVFFGQAFASQSAIDVAIDLAAKDCRNAGNDNEARNARLVVAFLCDHRDGF